MPLHLQYRKKEINKTNYRVTNKQNQSIIRKVSSERKNDYRKLSTYQIRHFQINKASHDVEQFHIII
ncbi:hypothetical protein DW182_13170 [Bacteroides sp. AM16-24]|nr:hypothetical protein DW182_13170 [Bacteroides sp. AM16-24]